MIIADYHIDSYTLNFKSEWISSAGNIKSKKGFIVTLITDTGLTGEGDCAPLEFMETESLESAASQLKINLDKLVNVSIDEALSRPPDSLRTPATNFSIETALLSLQSKNSNVTMAQLLAEHPATEINVNSVIGHLDDKSEDRLIQSQKKGFEVIKLKVGLLEIEEELRRINNLSGKLLPGNKLRLDANRAWSYDQAECFISGLSKYEESIDCLEEPLQQAELDKINKLQYSTPVKLALDESLPLYIRQYGLDECPVKRLIIKPVLLGGIQRSYQIAQQAKQQGIDSIVSSVFESATGLDANYQLAAALNNHMYHGLATVEFIDKFSASNLVVSDGKMFFKK